MRSIATPLRRGRSAPESPRGRINPEKITPEKRAQEEAAAIDQPAKRLRSSVAESLRGSSVVKIAAMSNAQIAEVMRTAGQMQELVKEHGADQSLKGKILASVFYEPSTRTNCSFQAAMLRLGGSVISVNESSSSVAKGETLSDTVRCMECYADVLVLRHPRAGAAAEAAAAMSKPLLNAGDGVGEHPSQALLDLYTIIDELSGGSVASHVTSEEALAEALKGKVVTMVGDLKNGRTVHSLAQLLGRFQVDLRYVSPAELRMPAEIVAAAAREGCSHTEHDALTESILQETDILYVTRVQKERFASLEAYDAVKDAFIITPKTLSSMKPTARVMHPLPRVNEIDVECDSDPRAAYFRQMTNGMYVRMAILRLILG
jgi:carbamoyl-phosphate synthase/aspartate carbamoyltransferase/dihydroorotase